MKKFYKDTIKCHKEEKAKIIEKLKKVSYFRFLKIYLLNRKIDKLDEKITDLRIRLALWILSNE